MRLKLILGYLTITTLPENKIAISYKWVYKVKYNVDDTIDRYKVCLIEKWYTQLQDLDYYDNFLL